MEAWKRCVAMTVVGGLVIHLPFFAAADGPVQPLGLVDMDARVSPARVYGQLVENSSAYVQAQVPSDGLFTLANPSDQTMSSATSVGGWVLFPNTLLSLGWWKIKDSVAVVSTFEVVSFGGTLSGTLDHQVIINVIVVDQCGAVPGSCPGPYHTQDLWFDSNRTPECYVTGTTPAPPNPVVPGGSFGSVRWITTLHPRVVLAPDVAYFSHHQDYTRMTQYPDEYWRWMDHILLMPTSWENPITFISHAAFHLQQGSSVITHTQGRCSNGLLEPFVPTGTIDVTITAGPPP